MARETLGEIALNRQDNEKDVPFFTPESEDISDGEESVHPALKDAASILCEGQEAMWVEDDVNEIFRRASSQEKSMNRKKNKFNLFRGKRKTTQKAVVLLPPQPVDKEDVENQGNQLAPKKHEPAINDLEETQSTKTEKDEKLDRGEVGVKESSSDADEPELVAGSESNEQEKEDDVEDVVHGSIDIPDDILEEMKLQVEDAVERARKDLDSDSSDESEPSSQFSSLGLTTDSLDFEEEYGVEMNIPSSGKAVEIVGTGHMILEAETIEQTDEAEQQEPVGKKAKWGLLRMFRSKPKQQKVSPRCSNDGHPEKTETVGHETEDHSPDPEVSEPNRFSPKPMDSSNHEPDRYSVAAPKAALADEMEESDTFSDDEEDAHASVCRSEEDEDDDFDDRYRIGPPRMSNSGIYDDGSTVSLEQEAIPNRDEDRDPALQIDCQEETIVASKNGQSIENTEEPRIVEETQELGADVVDDTNDLVEQDEQRDLSLSKPTKQDAETEKRKSRFVGIFGRRKMNTKPTTTTSRGKKAINSKECPSAEFDVIAVSKCQPDSSSKTPKDPSHVEPSPIASIKGDSMTVIADAVNKGALMAVESNLETEGTIKSRRIRTRADSSKDVIDLIRERTQNNNGKRQDPLDSSDTEVRMSISKDPAGKAMFEPKREKREVESLVHLAPTPRAKKTVEKVEEEQPHEISHQQQITQRLYGTPKGNGHLLTSKKVYIGDLLQGASTDPTVDSAISDEKETNEVMAGH